MSSLSEKKRELEKRCPGTQFIAPVRPDELRFQSPNQYGQIRVFSVNLKEMNQTAEEWLDEEIARHPEPGDRDKYYNVICPLCGKVQIGYSNYLAQMSFADIGWYCPNCQSPAEFDEITYESLSEERI